MGKRIVALAVAAALLFGMLPFPVSADHIAAGTCGDHLTWVIDEGRNLIIQGSGEMYDYSEETPPWYEYRDSIRVVRAEGGDNISAGAFRDCPKLVDLMVSGPHTIDAYAFSGCTNLKWIDLYSVQMIGEGAFAGCRFIYQVGNTDLIASIGDRAFEDSGDPWLFEFPFSDSLTHIGDAAFRNCSLRELSLGSNVESIGADAFAGCGKVGELAIPASVRFIGAGAFSEMNGITAFVVDPENPEYSNDGDGFLYNKDQTVLIQAPGQISSKYTAPQNLTAVESKAFYRSWNLTEVVLSDSTVDLGDSAFEECEQLTKITFGSKLRTIGARAFGNCAKLSDVILPPEIQSIGAEAFQDCKKISRIVFPSGVGFIGTGAFQHSGINRLVFTGDAPVFEEGALAGICATAYYPAENTTWTNKVMDDHDGAIEWVPAQLCSETEHEYEVTVFEPTCVTDGYTEYFCMSCGDRYEDGRVPALGHDFNGKSCTRCPERISAEGSCGNSAYYRLTTDGILTIYGSGYVSKNPLSHNGVKTLIVEDGITGICNSAFEGYYELKCARLPGSLVEIPIGGFSGCSNLAEVTIEEGVQSIGTDSFSACISLRKISLPNSITSIGTEAFLGCGNLENIDFGENVTTLGDYAFSGCNDLQKIEVPCSVTSIGAYAFSECSRLEKIEIPCGVTSIGARAFSACTKLKEIRFPDTLTTIGESAFENSAIKKVYFGDNMESLDDKVFTDCTTLETIEVSPDNQFYSSDTQGCLYDKEKTELIYVPYAISGALVIPDTVTAIDNYAFSARECIQSVHIGNGVESVGDYAFWNCANLAYVKFGTNVCEIGMNAFSDCSELKFYRFLGNAPVSKYSGLVDGHNVLIYYPGGNETWEDMENTQHIMLIPEYNCPEHHFDAVVTAPTCTAMGFTTYLCSSCGYSYQDDFVNALTHRYEENICAGCGYKKEVIRSGSGGDRVTWTMTSDGTLTFSGRGRLDEWLKNVPYDQVTNVVIEPGITEIASSYFSGCSNMTSIVIPDSVAKIGTRVFGGCSGLISVVLPQKLEEIPDSLFYECRNIKKIVIPESVTTIDAGAFWGCWALTNMVIPANVTKIDARAFEECYSLETLNLPDNISYIGENAFHSCVGLKWVEFDGRMPEIYETAFADCDCTIAYHGSDCSWTDLAGAQLGAMALEWVNLDDTVGEHIPENCPKLEPTCTKSGYDEYGFCANCGQVLTVYTVLAPLGHEYEETRVAAKCVVAGSVHGACIRCDDAYDYVIPATGHLYETEEADACCIVCGTPANCVADGSCGGDTFWYLMEDGTLTVDGAGPMTQTPALKWSSRGLVKTVIVRNGVTQICDQAFYNYSNLENVTLGANVEVIDRRAFKQCSSLVRIEIPASVQQIHANAFDGCTSMQAFVVNENNPVYSAGEDGILYNKDQTSLHLVPKKYTGECRIPDSVEKIEAEAFADCVELTAVYIPAGTTVISASAFEGCKNLAAIYADEGNQKYSSIDGCLYKDGNTCLECIPDGWAGDYVMPDTVRRYAVGAFKNCAKLTSITFSEDMDVSPSWTTSLEGCDSLRAFYVDADNPFLAADSQGGLYNRKMDTLYRVPTGFTGAYTVKEGTTLIAMDAFEDCKYLHILNIPASVTEIEGVDWRMLDGNTLYGCDGLSAINVDPDNPTYRSVDGCLYKSGFLLHTPRNLHGEITIPEGVVEIDSKAISGRTGVTSVTIPASVTSIGSAAFADCTGMSEIVFLGGAPAFAETESGPDVFANVTATAYRPIEEKSWTEENMTDYGGVITWVAYKKGETPWKDNDPTEPSEPVEPSVPVNPFGDVPEGSFFYDSVMWAVENEITNGATPTTFNPNGTCLRAQVVTFLHRADGNPVPTSNNNPFTDVKSSDFFYQPVLWAVEKGITNGTSTTTFGSYANCNRAAVVTFLWRVAGSPEPKSTNNPFADVKTTDFFYKPVLWAVENGITNGVDVTHFGPTADCNRAQVVTFLYRAYN